MKKEYINVPNALSLSRLVFLPILYVFIFLDLPVAFLIGYIVLGSTDFFDGFVARKFNQKTDIGKALDSFADVFFYVSTAWFIHKLYPNILEPNMPLLIAFFIVFFLSFVVSSIFCKKPIMMHTFILRLNGVLVYFLVITSFFQALELFNQVYIAIILILYLIAFFEEMIIFVKFGQVDPDTPTVFSLLKQETKE